MGNYINRIFILKELNVPLSNEDNNIVDIVSYFLEYLDSLEMYYDSLDNIVLHKDNIIYFAHDKLTNNLYLTPFDPSVKYKFNLDIFNFVFIKKFNRKCEKYSYI